MHFKSMERFLQVQHFPWLVGALRELHDLSIGSLQERINKSIDVDLETTTHIDHKTIQGKRTTGKTTGCLLLMAGERGRTLNWKVRKSDNQRKCECQRKTFRRDWRCRHHKALGFRACISISVLRRILQWTLRQAKFLTKKKQIYKRNEPKLGL